MGIDWSTVFEQAWPEEGLLEAEVRRLLAEVSAPISKKEAAEIVRSEKNPFTKKNDPELYAAWKPVNPLLWRMPSRPFPESYISFLTWSNGGNFLNGEREFGMFGTEIRSMAIAYKLPQYMPNAVPFAFNGGGIMYLFDMRESSRNGEYPILCASAGSFGWNPSGYALVANSFEEVCRGRINVEDILFPSDEELNKDEEGKIVSR